MKNIRKTRWGSAVLSGLYATTMCVGVAMPSIAGEDTGTLTVQTTVQDMCIFDTSIYNMDFGTYSGIADETASISVDISCNDPSVAWELMGGFGLHPFNQNCSSRRMESATDPTSHLNYDLFEDAGHTTQLCNNTGDEIQMSGDQTITIYGKIGSGQAVNNGENYSDVLGLSLIF